MADPVEPPARPDSAPSAAGNDDDDRSDQPPEKNAEEAADPKPSDPSKPPDRSKPTAPTVSDEERSARHDPRSPFNVRDSHGFVVNHFYSAVDAGYATFGATASDPAAGARRRRRTGRVDPAEIAEALRFYLPPPPYTAAQDRLFADHLVVLAGDDGDGRRAGAFALLQEVAPGRPLESLSPTVGLEELSHHGFAAESSFAIVDWQGDDAAEAVQRFHLEQVRAELRQTRTYLVVTASTEVGKLLPEAAVAWERPSPEDLFDRCLKSLDLALAAEARLGATSRILRNPFPRDVCRLATRLLDLDPEQAFTQEDEAEEKRVAEWFKQPRTHREITEVAALAFTGPVPEPMLERLHAQLQRLVAKHVIGEPEERRLNPPAEKLLRQARTGRRDSALVTTSSATGEPTAVFRSPRCEALVITELSRRYGYELWAPVEAWLREYARESDRETRAQLARGLTLYARERFAEVEKLVSDWSDGTVGERLIAAYVLSWMCLVEGLGPRALRLALGWGKRGDTAARQFTAAFALGGELGVQYQPEALKLLWPMCLRPEQVAIQARASVVELVRYAEADPAGAAAILGYLVDSCGERLNRSGPAGRKVAIRAVNEVLGARRRRPDDDNRHLDQTVVAEILRRDPDRTAPLLGALWAMALRGVPERERSLVALHRLLRSVGGDETAHRALVELGRQIRSHWTERERAPLARLVAIWLYRKRTRHDREGRARDIFVTALGTRALRSST